jgi:integrase
MEQASNHPKSSPKRSKRSRDGLFRRNGWWWLDYYDADGRRHRKKAAPDYQTAKIMYRDTMTAIAKGEVLGVREEGLRLKEFAEHRYWPTVKITLSPAEQARSRIILDRQLLPRFGSVKLSKLTREEIERWQAERLAGQGDIPPVTPSTANKELMRLKHLLNRAVAWGYLKTSPARAVRKSKEAPGRVRYLTPEERTALLDGAPDWLGPIIVAALHTGARRGELVGLRWADVDMRGRTVSFRHTKNGDSRTVALTETLYGTLRALPRTLDPETKVFPDHTPMNVSVAFGRLTRSLNLPALRFHDLRHDAASALTMAGVPQRTVMEILGHRDPRMTLRYQHLAPGHLRDAMRALDRTGLATAPTAVTQAH